LGMATCPLPPRILLPIGIYFTKHYLNSVWYNPRR
jgi:hypothetical protein